MSNTIAANATATNATTHTSCNPTKDVQAARGRRKGKPLTESQKATCKAAAAQHKFTKSREVTLHNAIVHDISEQGKAGKLSFLARHASFKLPDLHRMADELLENNPLSEEEAAELIKACRLNREHHHVSLRASNTVAAVDTRSTITPCRKRMGTRGIAFFTRGHLDDTGMPAVLQPGEAVAFCVEALKKPAVNILRLFEQWSCTWETAANIQCDNRQSMCVQTAKIIEEKLLELTRNDTVSIKPIECLQRIRDGWVKGDIVWVPMTAMQVKELAIDLATCREKNSGILKAQKTRKDAGQRHTSTGKGALKKRARLHESDDKAPAKSPDEDMYDSEGEHERPVISHHATRASEVAHALLASSQSPTVAAAANAAAHIAVPAIVAHTTAVLAGSMHTTAVLATIVLVDVALMTSVPADTAHGATRHTHCHRCHRHPHCPQRLPHCFTEPVDTHAVPAASSFVPAIIPTSFIAYTPGAALADCSNLRPQKRKATKDPAGSAPLKKARQPRSNKGTKRGLKGSNGAGPSSTTRCTPGSGYQCKMTPVEREALKGQTAARKAACTADALTAQPPPNYVTYIIHDIAEPTERSGGNADGIGTHPDGGVRPRDVWHASTAGAQRAGDGELDIANDGGSDGGDGGAMTARIDAEMMSAMGAVMALTVVTVTVMRAVMMSLSWKQQPVASTPQRVYLDPLRGRYRWSLPAHNCV
ncbi:hypothetical protein B0H17DRAFT_1139450 [Mycena rosella]|uniref:Uncharacterized protein n=1 Tax=Mycena rosella TaxID=1033263 RepID=A0AAD7D7V1_MYCRO|nr:hypothetical protein B0H17DRAFT_1139450 [Mycena rosella]